MNVRRHVNGDRRLAIASPAPAPALLACSRSLRQPCQGRTAQIRSTASRVSPPHTGVKAHRAACPLNRSLVLHSTTPPPASTTSAQLKLPNPATCSRPAHVHRHTQPGESVAEGGRHLPGQPPHRMISRKRPPGQQRAFPGSRRHLPFCHRHFNGDPAPRQPGHRLPRCPLAEPDDLQPATQAVTDERSGEVEQLLRITKVRHA